MKSKEQKREEALLRMVRNQLDQYPTSLDQDKPGAPIDYKLHWSFGASLYRKPANYVRLVCEELWGKLKPLRAGVGNYAPFSAHAAYEVACLLLLHAERAVISGSQRNPYVSDFVAGDSVIFGYHHEQLAVDLVKVFYSIGFDWAKRGQQYLTLLKYQSLQSPNRKAANETWADWEKLPLTSASSITDFVNSCLLSPKQRTER